MRQSENSLLLTQKVLQHSPSFKKIFSTLCIMLILGVSVWFYVWSRMQVVKLHYSIIALSKIEQEILKENKKMRLKLATLQSPRRIEYIAKNQLQLKDPHQEQVIYLK